MEPSVPVAIRNSPAGRTRPESASNAAGGISRSRAAPVAGEVGDAGAAVAVAVVGALGLLWLAWDVMTTSSPSRARHARARRFTALRRPRPYAAAAGGMP